MSCVGDLFKCTEVYTEDIIRLEALLQSVAEFDKQEMHKVRRFQIITGLLCALSLLGLSVVVFWAVTGLHSVTSCILATCALFVVCVTPLIWLYTDFDYKASLIRRQRLMLTDQIYAILGIKPIPIGASKFTLLHNTDNSVVIVEVKQD